MVIFCDIDGTLTDYSPGSLSPEKLLHGNFLFPILQRHLKKAGLSPERAAACILEETRRNVFWSYTGICEALAIPPDALEECRSWHEENLLVYQDTRQFLLTVLQLKIPLYFISNNPVDGCKMKLRRAGFCAEDGSPLPGVCGIYGTDVMLGCKFRADCWQKAFSLADIAPQDAVVLGDNGREDGEIPLGVGVRHCVILQRSAASALPQAAGITPVKSPDDFPWGRFFPQFLTTQP